jgi:hypothetical protein
MSERLILTEGKTGQAGEIRLFDAGDTPEIYADGIHGMVVTGETVKINFYTRDLPSVGEDFERRSVACRLVMPLEVFYKVADYFGRNSAKVKDDLAKLMEQEATKGA